MAPGGGGRKKEAEIAASVEGPPNSGTERERERAVSQEGASPEGRMGYGPIEPWGTREGHRTKICLSALISREIEEVTG